MSIAMKLTLRQLIAFSAIAEAGNTSAGGERIALSQSATSAALKELEAALEVRLFDRIGARLVLNDVGRTVLSRARNVIEGASDIEREFRGGLGSTELRLGATTTIGNYLLPTQNARYLFKHPEFKVNVRIENTARIVDAVARLELDFAFIEGPCHETDLVSTILRNDELIIVASPEHPTLLKRPARRLSVTELRNVLWLLREPGSGTRQVVESALLPHLKKIREGLRFGGTEAIKLAVANGLGFGCLSVDTVRDWVEHGRLVNVQTILPRIKRPLWLIHHRGKTLSQNAETFIHHCQNDPPSWR